MSLKEEVIKNPIPKHVAIIMDGNGRWAKKKGNSRIFGHKNGVTAVRETVEGAVEIGVKYLTLYAFSTENWNRPKEEVTALMSLLIEAIHNEIGKLIENNIQLKTIGDIQALPKNVQENLKGAIQKTSSNTGLNLIIALSYSSRWELLQAVKRIAKAVQRGELDPETLTDQTIQDHLVTRGIPDPDLLIRTSGELRISNFLLYQLAYSELYFTPVLWPDFRKDDFFKAILDFQKRERRFGKTSEQLK